MRKFFALFISSFIAIGCTFAFSSCNAFNPKEYETEYFIYHNWNNSWVEIVNLTDKGKQQEFLILPLEIDGVPVIAISNSTAFGHKETQWNSNKLEKIYVLKHYDVLYDSNVFDGCINLSKIISPYMNSGLPTPPTAKMYQPRIPHENRYADVEGAAPANVSFLWNFEDAENEGYYWIDDLDYGEKITLIPDEPIRKGYRFTGWYKEPECINLWDFSSDTTPVEQFDDDGNLIYQETCLYAGWIIVGG